MSPVDDLLQRTSPSNGESPATRSEPQVPPGPLPGTRPLQETQADMAARQSSNRLLAVPCPDLAQALSGRSGQSTTTALHMPLAIKAEMKRVVPTISHLQERDRRMLALLAPLLLLLITGGILLAATPLSHETPASLNQSLVQSQQGNTLIQSKSSDLNNLAAHAPGDSLPQQAFSSKSAYGKGKTSAHTRASASKRTTANNHASIRNTIAAAISGASLRWPVGQCTFWANERYHELSGYWVPWHGDAGEWVSGARRANWHVSTRPHIPAIIVLLPGVEGASSEYGHVAVAEKLLDSATVEASTMNWFANGGGFDIQSSWNYTVGSGVYFVWHP